RPHSEMSLHPGMPPRPPRRSGRSPWELRSQPLRRLAPELERASGRGELVEASGWPARAQNGLPEGLVVVPRQEGHRAREGSSLERQRPQGPAPVGGERRSRGGRPPRRKRTGRGGSRHAPPRSEATNTGPSKGDAGLKERLRVPVVLLRIRFLSDVSEPLTLRALCGIARALVMDAAVSTTSKALRGAFRNPERISVDRRRPGARPLRRRRHTQTVRCPMV